MNRQKQAVKEIQNKHAQSREVYPKSKTLMNEYKVKENSAKSPSRSKSSKEEGSEE